MDNTSEKKRIGAAVSAEVKKQMRVEAARRGETMSDLMRSAIERWLEEHADEPING